MPGKLKNKYYYLSILWPLTATAYFLLLLYNVHTFKCRTSYAFLFSKIKSLVSNFFQKMVQNCIPIVKGYVDDIQLVSSSTNKQELDPSFGN
jgi:hypothetical protein